MTRQALRSIGTAVLVVVVIAVVAVVVGPRLLPLTADDGLDGPPPSASVAPASPQPTAQASVPPGCFDPAAPAEPVVFTNPDGPPGSEPPEGFVAMARDLPTFGGVWVNEFRREMHIALTCDVDGAVAQIGHLVPRGLEVHFHLVEYTYAELQAIADHLFADREALIGEGIHLMHGGVSETRNRVEVGLDPLSDAVVEELRRRYGEPIEFDYAARPAPLPTRPPGGREILHAVAGQADDQPMVSCDGVAFPASVLDDPDAPGVPDDMLEDFVAVVEFWRGEFRGLERLTWRLAHRDDESASFLAWDGHDWMYLLLRRDAEGWAPAGAGGCHPTPVIDDAGPATWWLDPAFPAPRADATELHILVMERACASGQPAFGRISTPLVVYEPDSLTLTIGVRHVGGAATCPSNPPTPATVILPQPLGERSLLDGGRHPPAPPAPDY